MQAFFALDLTRPSLANAQVVALDNDPQCHSVESVKRAFVRLLKNKVMDLFWMRWNWPYLPTHHWLACWQTSSQQLFIRNHPFIVQESNNRESQRRTALFRTSTLFAARATHHFANGVAPTYRPITE